MPYRHRTAMSKKFAAAREAKAHKRETGPAPEYPRRIPGLRRRIVVIDYDFGRVVHRMDLYDSGRIDCYRVVADGVEWRRRAGFAKVLEGLRKAMPRVASERS